MERPWLSFYEKEVPQHIDYQSVDLYQFLKDSASKFPENTAMIFFGKKTSYKQLLKYVDSMATALKKLGIEKGSRVSISLPNSPQFIISFYSVLKLGAIVVQTNPLYVERELEHILNDSEAETIITLDLLYQRVKRVRASKVKNVIITSVKDFLPSFLSLLYPIKTRLEGHAPKVEWENVERFTNLIKTKPAEWKTEIDPKEDIALLQYTGGTTGTPKSAALTHLNLVVNTVQTVSWLTDLKRGEERILAAIPFFHVYGMTTCMNLAIHTGATLILVPKFDVKQILKLVQKYKPTIFPGVPTIYLAINSHPKARKYNLSSIRACISGAASLPVKVKEDFEKLTGAKLVEGYGLSEAAPVTHCNPLYGHSKPGSIGIPFPDTDAGVVDLVKGEEELKPGEIGELVIKGPQVMKGYWNLPEETNSALRGGWLYTGDIAKMDEDGYFYIVDRKKELIIVSGFNVYPREVEEVLYRHPKVSEVAVIGIPSEKRGETVKAFIVLKEGEMVSENEIKEFCKKELAKYKLPESVEFRDSFPKSLVGKVLKRVLIEEELKKAR